MSAKIQKKIHFAFLFNKMHKKTSIFIIQKNPAHPKSSLSQRENRAIFLKIENFMRNRNNLSKAEKIINQMRKKNHSIFFIKESFVVFFYKNKNKNPYKNSILSIGDRHLFSILDKERRKELHRNSFLWLQKIGYNWFSWTSWNILEIVERVETMGWKAALPRMYQVCSQGYKGTIPIFLFIISEVQI